MGFRRQACAIALGLGVLAACGSPEVSDDFRTLHRGNESEPLTLDPQKAVLNREFELSNDLFVGLYTPGPDGLPTRGLAESETISEDGRVWRFTLREMRWSDGAPVTAEDMAAGLRRLMDPATRSEYAMFLTMIENASEIQRGAAPPEALGVTVVDDRTLEIRLDYPAPFLPSLLKPPAAPLPRHALEAHGEDWVRPGVMVSNGPYVLAEWRSNNFVRLERNPYFESDEAVCFDEVFYYPTTDRQAALRQVRAGELDLDTGVPVQSVVMLRERFPELLNQSPGTFSNELIVNVNSPPFDDVRVRRALSMAIDRRFITQELFNGAHAPSWRFLPPNLPGAAPDVGADFADLPMAQRLEDAAAMLAEAGFGPDNPLSFRFHTVPAFAIVAPVLQQDWALIAPWVTAEIVQQDTQLHYAQLRAGDYQIGYGGWTATYPDPHAVLLQWETVSRDMNYSRWTDPAFDAAMNAAKSSTDPEVRMARFAEAERLVIDAAAHIPLYVRDSYDLVRPDITGWVTNPYSVNPSRWLCRAGADAG